MKNVLAATFAAAACLTSCTTQRSAVTTAAYETRVEQTVTVADLEVLPRVEAETRWVHAFFSSDRMTMDQRRENLQADVLREQGADVLLEPGYVCTRRLFGPCTLRVTGYPARLSNFRRATPADLEALRANVPAHRRRVYRVSELWQQKLLPLLRKKKS